jgi:hypothetical protein
MQLVRSGPAGSAALELAVSHALLTRVAAGELPSTLRVYRPAPAVATQAGFGAVGYRVGGGGGWGGVSGGWGLVPGV